MGSNLRWLTIPILNKIPEFIAFSGVLLFLKYFTNRINSRFIARGRFWLVYLFFCLSFSLIMWNRCIFILFSFFLKCLCKSNSWFWGSRTYLFGSKCTHGVCFGFVIAYVTVYLLSIHYCVSNTYRPRLFSSTTELDDASVPVRLS